MNLSNTKIYVSTPIKSQTIQEKAFQLGWKWGATPNTEIKFLDSPYLFFDEERCITYSDNANYFHNHSNREIKYGEVIPSNALLTDLSNTRIWFKNILQKEAIQRKAFELGWSWQSSIGHEKEVKNWNMNSLFFHADRSISHSTINKDRFENDLESEFKIITLADLGLDAKQIESDGKTKTLIGYRVKNGVDREAALRALNADASPSGREYEFEITSSLEDRAKELGLLDLLFEPVFEEEGYTIEIPYNFNNTTDEKGMLKVELTRRLNDGERIAKCGGYTFDKGELEKVLRPIHSRVKFVPRTFDIGCQQQYKHVKAEDIQKIIDAIKKK